MANDSLKRKFLMENLILKYISKFFGFIAPICLISLFCYGQFPGTGPAVRSGSPFLGNPINGYNDLCFDSKVTSIQADESRDRAVLGGWFSRTGPCTGDGVIIGSDYQVIGSPNLRAREIKGIVYSSLPDGSGGWYIAGSFSEAAGIARPGIARLNSDGTLNASFNPSWFKKSFGEIRTLSSYNGILYAGGSFAANSPAYGAPLDRTSANSNFPLNQLTSGTLTPFNKKVNAVVDDGSGGWYVGGEFTQVQGQAISYLAHLNADGTVIASFNHTLDAKVNILRRIGSKLYVVGDFTQFDGSTRAGIARLDLGSGTLDSWNPKPTGTVTDIEAASSGDIFISGNFFSVNADVELASGVAVNISSGAYDSSWPAIVGGISGITSDGSGGFYISGQLTKVGNRSNLSVAHIKSDKTVDANFGVNNVWAEFVNTIHYTSTGRLFVGGSFSKIGGLARNNFAELSPIDGSVMNLNIDINNSVSNITSSGNLLFVGGQFTQANSLSRLGLATIDLTTDSLHTFNPVINSGRIDTMDTDGNTLFMGGTFTQVNSTARRYAAAVTISTGALTAWNPNPNGYPQKIKINATTAYVVGSFSTIGGSSRNRIAAVNLTNGTATAWNPNANNWGNTIELTASKIFIGGYFTAIGASPRYFLASWDITTGNLDSWSPAVSDSVGLLAVLDSSTLFVAGSFKGFGGTNRRLVAKIDSSTAAATSWDANVEAIYGTSVSDIKNDSSKLYLAGSFTKVGGATRNYLSRVDESTAAVDAWAPVVDSSITAMDVSGSSVFIGGYFSNAGGSARSKLAEISTTTGLATSWNPAPSTTIDSISIFGSKLYVMGNFSQISGTSRSSIARYSLPGLALDAWNPNTQNVLDVFDDGSQVYLATQSSSVGANKLQNAVAFDASTGNQVSWNLTANSQINSILASAQGVFVGGNFTTLNSTTRNYIGRTDLINGTVDSWNPSADWWVMSLGINNSRLFVGGEFSTIAASSRNAIASFDLSTGNIESWNPVINCCVYAMTFNGSNIFVGGSFTNPRTRIASIDLTTGALQSWNSVGVDYTVYALSAFGNDLLVGGEFWSAGTKAAKGLVAFDISSAAIKTNSPAVANITYTIATQGANAYIGGDLGSYLSVVRSGIAAVQISTGRLTTWNPALNDGAYVYALKRLNNTLYVGGIFNSIGSISRTNLAGIDLNTARATSLTVSTDGPVRDLEIQNSKLYVAGQFSNLGGLPRNNAGSVDLSTSSVTSFNPNFNGIVKGMDSDGTDLYFVGGFTTANGGTSRKCAARYDLAALNLASWNINSSTIGCESLSATGSQVYITGYNSGPDAVAFDKTTGAQSPTWSVDLSNTSYLIQNGNSQVYLGGWFTDSVGGSNYLVGLDPADSSIPISLFPFAGGSVDTIEISSNYIFLGGWFTKYNGRARSSFIQINRVTGTDSH